MAHMLKNLPFPKKKESDDSNLKVTREQQRWDPQEAHFSGSHPSNSPHSATQRTTQVLPLLVKSSAVPAEVKKKAQSPALGLPDLGLRTTLKSPSGNAQVDDRQGKKETATLQKASEREKSQRSTPPQSGRRSADVVMPFYPELSDECFRPLWESKRPLKGRSVKDVLEMMDEKEVLDTILDHLRPSLHISAEPKPPRKKMDGFPSQKSQIQQSSSHILSQEKILLYKYYGVKLRNSRQKSLVKEQLKRLLGFSFQEETDREGISESIGVAAFCHLPEILIALRDTGHFGHAKTPALLEATFEDPHTVSERQIRTALILCYGQAALGAQPEDMIALVEHIVSEILFQYSMRNKDEALKKAFMRAVIMITKALVHSRKQDVNLPHKLELVINIIEVIENEPVRPLSIIILHQAIITVTCMTRLKPTLNTEVMSKLVNTSIQRVFSLPALKMTKVNAGSPTQSSYTQDFYHQTVTACSAMLTGLLSETPNLDSLQDILMHTNIWISSPKIHERERAIKSTWYLLKFVSEQADFDTTADFFMLGQLVALLGLHIGEVKEIGQTSAEAAYHLHYIIMNKMAKEMDKKPKNKKGNIVKWLREDFFGSGSGIFYNNISKMAKAFGEHLSPLQITDLILKALEGLTDEDKNISQSAGILLNSFLEECGMDMEELPMVVRNIYQRLPNISDPATKENTLKSVCHLASKRVNKVVDLLLECSVDCDQSAREIWRALVADPYANMKIMRPLLKRLQDEDPLSETTGRRNSTSIMPIAATNALCFILSIPEASEAIENKFPHLIIALITQIYFLLGGTKRGSRKSSATTQNSGQINPLNSAVQALKNLIKCAGYLEEYNTLGKKGCWRMLMSPDSLFEAIFHLVRTLFAFSTVQLKLMFRQANTYLRHSDIKVKTIGMAFFSELLYHPEIGHIFMTQDILEVLHEWMIQPHPIIQIFSIRGLGYLLQHPFENKNLESLLIPVANCAAHPDRNISKEALRTLQFMFRHLDIESHGYKAVSLIPHLLKYFPDEDTELRYNSIVLFGMLLRGVDEANRSNISGTVLKSIVPLFIQLSDGRTKEASRNALHACVKFMTWEDVPSDLFLYETYVSLHSMYLAICSFIISKCRQHLPDMMAQMLHFLRSRNPSHQEASALLIACCAPYMKPDVVSSKDIEEIYLALRELQNDSEASVAQVATQAMEEIFRQCGHRINPDLIASQILTKFIRNLSRQPSETTQ